MKRASSFLPKVLGIKPGEAGLAVSFFAYFFLVTAPFYIIKPIRDASYLDELGSRNLPWAYGTAFLVGLVVALHSKIQARLRRPTLIVGSLAFFVLTGLAFWLLFPLGWRWLPLAFWMWANTFIVVLVTQFWIAVNDVFNPREAKRLIGFFGSGGILGGIVGALSTAFLARTGRATGLLLPAALVLALSVIPVLAIFRRRPGETGTAARGSVPDKVGFKACLDTVRGDGYLKLLAGVVLVTGIMSTFVDWQSKNIIENWPQARANFASFFGFFNAALLVFSFLLQILLTSNLIERYGLRLTLLVYPALLLACSLGIALWPGILLAVGIKGVDKSLSYSLNQSSRELLYIPVRPDRKYRAKIFIDMFLNRFAKSIGAVLLLGLFLLPFRPLITLVSLAAAVLAGAWIALNRRVGRAYVDLLKSKLESRWGRAEKLVAERVDVGTAKLMFDTLESRRRSPVLFAQHLFDLLARNKLTPEVRAFLTTEMQEGRIASLGGLFESESGGWVPELGRPEDAAAWTSDIREIFNLDVYQRVMQGYVDKVVSHPEDEVSRMEVAKALGWMGPGSSLAPALESLLRDRNVEVVRYALESAARLGRREDVPFLIDRLSDPALAQDARLALERYGGRIAGTLSDILADEREDPRVRKSAVMILATVDGPEAADYLLAQLSRGERELGGEIIDALDRMRADRPGLVFGESVVRRALAREIEAYCRGWLAGHKAEAGGRPPAEQAARLESGLRNIFRLLGLIFPREDMQRAYQNLQAGTRESTAYALELLDNLLPRDLKVPVLLMVGDLAPAERVRRMRDVLGDRLDRMEH
jgi:AAA family ATP:ADP antiporter